MSRDDGRAVSTDYQHLRVEIDDQIALLTIARPEVRNALNLRTVQECHDALAVLARDPDIGVLIITGEGSAAFVSGADIRDIQVRTLADGLAAINSSLFTAVERFPRPTIAAVNGYALGGGCELALACDIRIASEHAKFGQPELGLGIIPGAGATQRLPRIVGLGRAKHLILTGEIIDAGRALEFGLVSAVVPAPDLLTAAKTMAGRILRRGPLAARLAKIALNASTRVDLDSGLLIETLAQAICYDSDDKREGTTAFLEKREPRFKGR
ncbi:MAG: enoyl-CoA hydratase/isomerase family protein [Acidobacteria bacterium]|nr:enoyl-CoA hydratase/isomerase family protein [Acidobacteriota bacterium]